MKNSTFHIAILIFFASLLVFPARLLAQDGSLDLNFDSDGLVTTAVGASHERAFSVVLQSDGKIIVAGNSFNGAVVDFAIVRYNTDGSLDNSFDLDGIVTTTFGPWDAYGVSAAIQADGKILVAGNIGNGANSDFVLVRYNSNGSLDSSFGIEGIATTAIGTYGEFVYAMTIQSDGKILVAGSSDNGPDDDFALVRYNTDGSLDNAFSSDGKVTTSIGTANDVANAMVLQPDGKIVLSGVSYNGSDFDFTLVRYNTDGSLDTAFDTDGLQTTNMGLTSCAALSIGIAQDGKILVAGRSTEDGDEDVLLVRYTAEGVLDNSFDSDGIVTTEIGDYDEAANSMVIQMDGKIVVAGYSLNGSDNDFALARYNYTSTSFINAERNETLEIAAYPNPCSGTFFLKNIADNSEISVYNITGRKVVEQKTNPSNEIVLPQNCSTGIYTIRVFDIEKMTESILVFMKE